MPYFVPYFVFDPSVKFRFKTQCCAIDGIDAILSRGKMKKSGYGREKYGSWRKNNKNPVRIYAIYGIYGTHCVSERVAGGSKRVATGESGACGGITTDGECCNRFSPTRWRNISVRDYAGLLVLYPILCRNVNPSTARCGEWFNGERKIVWGMGESGRWR